MLRAYKSIDYCHFDSDNLETTANFGLFDRNNLIGGISIFEAKTIYLKQKNSFEFVEWQKEAIGFYEKMEYQVIKIAF